MAADLTGATTAEFQEAAPKAQLVGDEQADIVKHDPNTYAGLTAQNALKTMFAQGLQPTGDDIKKVYSQALQDAGNYHAHQAEQQEAANVELQKRGAAVTSGLLTAEKSTEAAVAEQSEERKQQFEQTGLIHRATDKDVDRVNGFVTGYNTADTLQKYHTDMAATTPGAAGWLKSHTLGFLMQPNITSQETKDFNAYLESSIVPLGKGVFGDAATAATKESIQANMRDMLSNTDDNPLSAGHKTWMLKDRIMNNLITDRATAVANHTDPAIWDQAIGKLIGNYNSPDTRQFAPGFANNPGTNPVVQSGNSAQTKAAYDNVNAGANAGIPQPQMTPTGYVSGPGTATGGPTGSPGAVPAQQTQQTTQQNQPNMAPLLGAYGGM